MSAELAIAAMTQEEAWFSAAELAELALPGLPTNKRGINLRASEERWASRVGNDGEVLVRKRTGRGGGTEYHLALLPGEARLELLRRGVVAEDAPKTDAATQRADAWNWFERQPAKVKREAEERLSIIAEVEALEGAGASRIAAVAAIAQERDIGSSTIFGWIKKVRGLDRADRLPALASRRKGGGAKAAIPDDLWLLFKSLALRPSAPTLTSCYERVAAAAEERGVSIPVERTFRRRLKAEVPPEVWTLKRQGEEALVRSVPANRRTVAGMHALEWVNIDGHKFDVRVAPPPMHRSKEPIRPMLVAIQDVYSRKIVAWRLGCEESAIQTRLAFADLFREWGIPHHALLDNSRAFWSKWITGGYRGKRFRFKVKQEEPVGLLTGVGVQVHAALPYHGQSKPIERAFRDLENYIGKAPECEGAYTGPSPMAKPSNYGTKVVEWDTFSALVDEWITRHNARTGRRTEAAKGRSFDEVFAESYATSRISKASPEHLRWALLAADQKKLNSLNGEIELHGNRYWHRELSALRGELVTVRFDPDNLHSEVHVYDLEGRYITAAPELVDSGFADVAGAKEAAKRTGEYRKRAKALAEAEELISADALIELQAGSKAQSAKPEAGVVAPVRHPDAEAQRSPRPKAANNAATLDRMRAGLLKRAANSQ